MKFEVKTQKQDLSKSTFFVFLSFSLISIIIILSTLSIKIGNISRHYQINYLCNLLTIERSSINLRKLSKITNLTTKQKILDLCREIIK